MLTTKQTLSGDLNQIDFVHADIPIPPTNQFLVRVIAAGIYPGDSEDIVPVHHEEHAVKNQTRGLDFVGVFHGVGMDTQINVPFRKGDIVYGRLKDNKYHGTLSQYVIVNPERDCIAHKPDRLTVLEAGCVSVAATTAYACLVDHCGFLTRPGRRLAIIGASGGVGVMAIQMARLFDPQCHLTAICSEKNIPLVLSLGATDALAYDADTENGENFMQKLENLEMAGEYDSVIDLVGGETTKMAAIGALLMPRGTYSCPVHKKTIQNNKPRSDKRRFSRWMSSLVQIMKNANPPVRLCDLSTPMEPRRFIEVNAILETANFIIPTMIFPYNSAGDAMETLRNESITGKVVVHVDMEKWPLSALSRRIGKEAREADDSSEQVTFNSSDPLQDPLLLEQGGKQF